MRAGGLRGHVSAHGQFARRQRNTAHQSLQHAGPRGIADEGRNRGNIFIHKLDPNKIFAQDTSMADESS